MKKYILSDGDYNLHVYKWDQVTEIKGIIQIFQGLNETGDRYDALAKALNKAGYIVYTHDAPGQGKTKQSDVDIVDFGPRGFKHLVEACYVMRKRIAAEYKTQEIYAIGNSLGSLLLRYLLIEDTVEYHKVVISGAGLSSTKGMSFTILLASILALFKGNQPSDFFDNRVREIQLKIITKTDIDHFIEYLTRDEIQNELDKKDPYLFNRLSKISYVELLKLIKFVNTEKYMKHTHPAINSLILSGSHDPMTNFGKDSKELSDFFYRMGIHSKVKIYNEARHNLFDEINKEEIFEDVIKFLNS